jgi:hypothetical protein
MEAATMRQLLDGGFTPESIKAAIIAQDWDLLEHTGLYSVQLQPPGTVPLLPATTNGSKPDAVVSTQG